MTPALRAMWRQGAGPLGTGALLSDPQQDSNVQRVTGEERTRLRFAATRAKRVFSGPIGELISRELISWEQFGYRIGGKQAIMELARAVEEAAREQSHQQGRARGCRDGCALRDEG